jgi:GT2 family glycosyltransferase
MINNLNKSHSSPEVSVIIVNFNGKHYLKTCLDSVFKQSIPQSKFEVIVVDNNSSDNSVAFINKSFPKVSLIESKTNRGFAGGNNLGVEQAQGKYIVLLNNDTKVSRNWLKFLLEKIKSDSKIAAVNSKSFLYYPFVKIQIDSDVFMHSDFTNSIDFKSVGVSIEEVVTNNDLLQRMIQYYQGFYKEENKKNQVPLRWTDGHGVLLLPIDPDKASAKYFLTVRSQKSRTNIKTSLKIQTSDHVLVEDTLDSHEVKQYQINLKTDQLKPYLCNEVQNAGNVVFKSGHSRDRGAVVHKRQQYYEVDSNYFEKSSEIGAFCGVSVILRKDLFEKMGGFDESYFMYYEDVDLSLSLRRQGYKLVYEPKSTLRHIHAGSSGEWSPFFNYHVEKNHLATLVKHFPVSTILTSLIRHAGLTAFDLLVMLRWRLSEHWTVYEEAKEKFKMRVKALKWLSINFPKLVITRRKLGSANSESIKDIYQTHY